MHTHGVEQIQIFASFCKLSWVGFEPITWCTKWHNARFITLFEVGMYTHYKYLHTSLVHFNKHFTQLRTLLFHYCLQFFLHCLCYVVNKLFYWSNAHARKFQLRSFWGPRRYGSSNMSGLNGRKSTCNKNPTVHTRCAFYFSQTVNRAAICRLAYLRPHGNLREWR